MVDGQCPHLLISTKSLHLQERFTQMGRLLTARRSGRRPCQAVSRLLKPASRRKECLETSAVPDTRHVCACGSRVVRDAIWEASASLPTGKRSSAFIKPVQTWPCPVRDTTPTLALAWTPRTYSLLVAALRNEPVPMDFVKHPKSPVAQAMPFHMPSRVFSIQARYLWAGCLLPVIVTVFEPTLNNLVTLRTHS